MVRILILFPLIKQMILFKAHSVINQFLLRSIRFSSTVRSNHNPNLDLLSLVNEDYIAGYTQDGQMSTVRRFFCLFVIFDLFFISMLWFICIMVSKYVDTDVLYLCCILV